MSGHQLHHTAKKARSETLSTDFPWHMEDTCSQNTASEEMFVSPPTNNPGWLVHREWQSGQPIPPERTHACVPVRWSHHRSSLHLLRLRPHSVSWEQQHDA